MFNKADKLTKYVERLKDGDGESFSRIYDLTFSRMMYYARVYLRDKQKAEDVVNDAYVKFCLNLDKIDPQKSVMNWLIKVVRNTAFDYNRKDVEVATEDFDKYEAIAVESEDLDDRIIIKEGIDGLDAADKELFYLYYIEDRTIRNVAEIQKRSKTAVWQDVQRLNRILKGKVGIDDER